MLRLRRSAVPVRHVLLLGGTSEIGLAIVAALRPAPGALVTLAGRDEQRTVAAAQQLRDQLPGVATRVRTLATQDVPGLDELLGTVFRQDGPVDVVIPAFGVLPDQQRAAADAGYAADVLQVNLVAQIAVLLGAARRMRWQGHGQIVVLSSIAGTRLRPANFLYGTTKAALDVFALALGSSLRGTGVRVLVVRPGFVVGRMTEGMLPAPFSCTPAEVAAATVRALHSGASSVWVPRRLAAVALLLRLLPEPLVRRLPR